MLKYAKIINNETKVVSVFTGSDIEYALSKGFTEQEVEKAYNGNWYLIDFAPVKSEKTYQELRILEYPEISEQLDMLYWDKANGTNLWQEKIAEIKAKYPKI